MWPWHHMQWIEKAEVSWSPSLPVPSSSPSTVCPGVHLLQHQTTQGLSCHLLDHQPLSHCQQKYSLLHLSTLLGQHCWISQNGCCVGSTRSQGWVRWDWWCDHDQIQSGIVRGRLVEIGMSHQIWWNITTVRKTLKLNSLFFFIYFRPREPKRDSKHSQTDRGNSNSHARNYSIVYTPVRARPRSTIKHSKIHVT